jgi:hypothetical protein
VVSPSLPDGKSPFLEERQQLIPLSNSIADRPSFSSSSYTGTLKELHHHHHNRDFLGSHFTLETGKEGCNFHI